MPFIATDATTVGEAVDQCAAIMLNGLYAESITYTRKGDIERNEVARRAVQQFADLLKEVYCADRDTLLKDIPTPV